MHALTTINYERIIVPKPSQKDILVSTKRYTDLDDYAQPSDDLTTASLRIILYLLFKHLLPFFFWSFTLLLHFYFYSQNLHKIHTMRICVRALSHCHPFVYKQWIFKPGCHFHRFIQVTFCRI